MSGDRDEGRRDPGRPLWAPGGAAPAAAITVAAAAFAGALLGGGSLGPPGNPVAAPGLAAVLASGPVAVLGAALVFARVRQRGGAPGQDVLRALAARGASGLQLRLLAAGPVAAVALACGLVFPVPAAALAALPPLHAAGRGFLPCLGASLAAGLLSAAVVAALALAAPRPGPAHPRERDAPAPRPWRRLWLDVALLGLSAAAGYAGWSLLDAPGGGLPALRPLAYAGAGGLILGAALLAVRLAGALARAALRLRPDADAGTTLALRAAARGSAAVWPVALGALGAGAVVFALSGGPAAAAVGRTYRSLAAGADARVRETVARPCGACNQPFQAFVRDWPFPDLGALQAGLPGVAGAALLVPGADQVTLGAEGSVPATVWGIDPAAFGGVVTAWPSGMGRSGPADLRLLGRSVPGGAIISASLAAEAGVGPGGRLQSRLLGVVPVLAVAPAWPGVGASDPDWLVVQWTALQAPLQRSGPWTTRGFTFDALWRLVPGADVHPALAALRDRDVTVDAAVLPGLLQAGAGWLPFALWPLAAAAALLWWWGWDVAVTDPRALPDREAAVALSAEGAVARATALLRAGGAAWGGALGGLAGWAAAAVFWPDLGFADVQASLLGLRVPPLGGVLAAACAAAGAVGALRVRMPPPAPPLVLPEPRGRAEHGGGDERAVAAPARTAGRARRRRGLGIRGVVLPAFARLRFGWPRLLGLAAGLLLAASVSATVPLYVGGALTRVLHAGLQPENSRPAGAVLVRYLPPAGAGAPPPLAEMGRLQAATAAAGASVGLPSTAVTTYMATAPAQVESGAGSPVSYGAMTIDALSGLEAHIRIVQGRSYASSPDADGALEAVVTESAYTSLGLTVGGLYTVAAGGGPTLRIRLVGVFDQLDPTGPYWPYLYYPTDFLVAPQVLRSLVWTRGALPLGSAAWYTTLDLTRLDAAQVPAAAAGLQRVAGNLDGLLPGAEVTVSPYAALQAFTGRAAGLRDLLRLVSIPVIALALYFVAITAGLIVDADSAEIAVLASRGAGAGHIVLLYLLEWMLLAVPVAALAPLPAAAFARLMGAADGFLRFRPGPPLPVAVSWDAYASAGAAAAAGVVAALVPVAVALRRTVVEARQRSSRVADRPLWQRAYLDFAGLVVLGLLLLVFRSASLQPGAGAAAIAGDPGLYLLPAAFLAACALLLVRVVGWAFRTLDALVGDRTPLPAAMPLRRIGRQPARFAPVLLLLCFTAALGSYSAAAARTMDANLAAAVDYRVGAPLRLAEVSPCTTEQPEAGACVTYDPAPMSPSRGVRPMPPFALHAGVPGIAAASEIETEPVTVTGAGGAVASTTLVLVDPATYGAVGWWGPRLDPLPLATYLAVLAARPGAIFLSPGLLPPAAEVAGAPVAVTDQLGSGLSSVPFSVAGPVLRWPGAGVQAPFALAALGPAERALGIVEVQRIALIRPAPGATAATITTGLAGRGILASSEDESAPEVAAALGTPEWAGQSGLLSVGFLVALAVTAAGYLFYAALLLRGQITQFGLLRALGLPWGRLVGSVAAEQGGLLLTGGAAGTAVGLAAAALFLPLFRPAFSGPGAPPFLASGPGGAFGEVAGLTVALMATVLGALLLLLRRLHVGETVKLEE